MSVVTELFRSEENGTLSFGDYTLDTKAKKDKIEFEGDMYKVKTFKTMTKLDKNGQLIFESVPGSAVHNFAATTDGVAFEIEASEDVQVTLEVEPEQEYRVYRQYKCWKHEGQSRRKTHSECGTESGHDGYGPCEETVRSRN